MIEIRFKISLKANIFYMEMSQFSGEGKLVSLNELMIAKDFSYPVEKSVSAIFVKNQIVRDVFFVYVFICR